MITQHIEEMKREFDERFGNKEDGQIGYWIPDTTVHCDGRPTDWETVKDFLLSQLRLARADERKQAYEDGKKEGAKWIDVLRELLLRSGESEKEIVLKEMFEVARRLDTPPAKPNY